LYYSYFFDNALNLLLFATHYIFNIQALLLEERLPSLEGCAVGNKYSSQFNALQRLRLRDDYIRRGQQVRIVKVCVKTY